MGVHGCLPVLLAGAGPPIPTCMLGRLAEVVYWIQGHQKMGVKGLVLASYCNKKCVLGHTRRHWL